MSEGRQSEPLAERVRTVYGKDLYGEKVSLNVRLDTDEFEHGDTLRITVDRLESVTDRDTESPDDRDEEER